MDRMHDDRQKSWAEEREQARACGCKSCREKYGLPLERDHDTNVGWAIIGGLALAAASAFLLKVANSQQHAA